MAPWRDAPDYEKTERERRQRMQEEQRRAQEARREKMQIQIKQELQLAAELIGSVGAISEVKLDGTEIDKFNPAHYQGLGFGRLVITFKYNGREYLLERRGH